MPGPEQAREAAIMKALRHTRTPVYRALLVALMEVAWDAALAWRDAEVAELLERWLGEDEPEVGESLLVQDTRAMLASIRSRTGDG